MNNLLYRIAISLLLFSSCSMKEQKNEVPLTISTAESVRDGWLKSRKALGFTVDGMPSASLKRMDRLGVFSIPSDATLEEQLSLTGVPFRYHPEVQFLPENGEILTGDSLSRFYVCYPYLAGLSLNDSLSLKAPYREYLYGEELSRAFSDKFSVRFRMNYSTSLLRLRLESLQMTDRLHKVSVAGQRIFTRADYMPYTGQWLRLTGANQPIVYPFDRVMNNYQFVDVLLPPVDEPSDITLRVGMNAAEYTARTTLPRLGKGEMTQLNLALEGTGLKITSSWVEERTGFLLSDEAKLDTVKVGNYLQNDGSISQTYDSASIAVVYVTDGKHGKAVALKDEPGLWRFSSRRLSSGKIFRTVDGSKQEGFINPSQTDGVEKESRLVYKPSLLYPDNCAFGYKNGCSLSMSLLDKSKERESDDMLTALSSARGAFVPSVAELATLYYLVQPYSESPFTAEEFTLPVGEYLSSCESSASNFYMFEFSHGIVTGAFSKQFARLKLRLFYLF